MYSLPLEPIVESWLLKFNLAVSKGVQMSRTASDNIEIRKIKMFIF